MNFSITDIKKNTSNSSSSTSNSSTSSSSVYTPLNYLPLIVQSSNLAGNNGVIKLSDTNYLLSDSGWKFSMVNTGGTFTDLMTLDANGNLLVKGDVCAYAVGSFTGDTGSTSGLIKSVYGYSNLGNSFDNSDLGSTFNAYTINQLNSRLVTIENKNYLTDLTSELLISTLGYTPYSANNPSGYVTISSIPTKLSQLNNDLGNYGNFVTGTPWTSQGYITNASLTSYVQKAGDVMTGNLTTKGLSITNGTQTVNLVVDANGYLSVDNNLYSSGDISAFGAGTGSTGGGSGLIQTVYSYSNLGGTFSNATLTDTFNAYTINQMNNRLVSVENGSLTSISSDLVISALGYTPYNASNPSGFITSSSLPTKTSQLTNDSGFITGINSSQVTTALGYTPYNSTNPSGFITSSSLPTNNNQLTNGAGYITSSALSPYQLISTAINTSNIGSQSVNYANSTTYINSPDGDRNPNTKLPTTNGGTVRFDFAQSNYCGTGGNYAGVMTYAPWAGTTSSTGDASYQLAFGGTAVNGGGVPMLRIRKGIDSTWNSFYTIWHEGNLTPSNYQLAATAINTSNIGSQSVNYANSAGSANMLNGSAHTNGSDGWFRSAGNCGWYNETYATGIYSTESGNVRTYNGANFISSGNLTATGEVYASNGFKTNTLLGMIGDYNENGTTDKIIWTIGQSWNTIANHYGLGYTYNNVSGFGHSLFMAVNGTKTIQFSLESGSAKFNGNILANGEVTAYTTSDKRLKKNIKPINNSLSIINKLKPVSYNWNEKAKELNPNKDNKKDVGVIAQELEKVLPNLVHNIYSDEQYKGVDYIKLIPYLIGAIQELTTEINKLKNK